MTNWLEQIRDEQERLETAPDWYFKELYCLLGRKEFEELNIEIETAAILWGSHQRGGERTVAGMLVLCLPVTSFFAVVPKSSLNYLDYLKEQDPPITKLANAYLERKGKK